MRYVVSAMLVVVAIIHLMPLSGVLGAERLSALYGLQFGEPNLALLMRHRAVLFELLGVFLLAAAFRPEWQPLAFAAGVPSCSTCSCASQFGTAMPSCTWAAVATGPEGTA